jgi:ABC-type polysaccharide/polyol phosphate export permease
VNILLQFGMWITPIMWDYHLFGESMLKYLKLNPFFYISEGYRDSMLNHVWFWEKPVLTLYFWLVALLIFAIGTALFKRLRPHFADVL